MSSQRWMSWSRPMIITPIIAAAYAAERRSIRSVARTLAVSADPTQITATPVTRFLRRRRPTHVLVARHLAILGVPTSQIDCYAAPWASLADIYCEPSLLGATVAWLQAAVRAAEDAHLLAHGASALYFSALDDALATTRRAPRGGEPEHLFPRDIRWQFDLAQSSGPQTQALRWVLQAFVIGQLRAHARLPLPPAYCRTWPAGIDHGLAELIAYTAPHCGMRPRDLVTGVISAYDAGSSAEDLAHHPSKPLGIIPIPLYRRRRAPNADDAA